MSGRSRRAGDHYSYTVYADPATAETFDDRRFGGPIGSMIASTQSRVLTNMIGRIQNRRILDVGTGTGRAARLLARGGAIVTAIDSSEQMLAVARKRAEADGVTVNFLVGDAHALDFQDRAFDVAVSLRVLMHTPGWKRCIAELCRVAERLVVIDYPSAMSAALAESLVRGAAHRLGVRTEPYRVFSRSAIEHELARSNFTIRSMHRQFVMPIAFHKAIGSRRFTEFSEGVLDRAGLLRLFGSPVTLVAERCASS